MMKTNRFQTSLFNEIIVDNFAGGGGASTGIEMALGRIVNIAINHDPEAIRMHKTNHPYTEHLQASVWDIDPVKVCCGRPVGLAWFSPDCKHFSKAKGGTPVEKKIRGLAWIALRWAGTVRPRIIVLENVEEFKTWGPVRKGKPIKKRAGETFKKFLIQLRELGYNVEFRELVAADYGTPTTRKRFFLIARCDGNPIVWPEPTHGKDLKPYRTAAEIIDWSVPCPSIFERSKPLAENTLRRIARGIQKFVINSAEPFIVNMAHGGKLESINNPVSTICTEKGGCRALITPFIAQAYGGGYTGAGQPVTSPVPTITQKDHNFLVAPIITQYHSYETEGTRGQTLDNSLLTVDTSNRYALVSAFISKFYKTGIGQDVCEPLHTVTTSPGHFAEVRAFLIKYYGQGIGQSVKTPLDTIVGHDRFGLVTVQGEQYQIVDIGMRMLTPKELYRAQGFPEDYIIERDYTGKAYSKAAQVARCGNAVCPPIATAIVKANMPEYAVTEDLYSMFELGEMIAV
jgi:DNA (cytosine-5)-methyltransferase 1